MILRSFFLTGHVVVVRTGQRKRHPAEYLVQSRLTVGVLRLEVLEGRARGALELAGHGLEVVDQLAKLVDNLVLDVVHMLRMRADDICFAKLEAVPCAHSWLLLMVADAPCPV